MQAELSVLHVRHTFGPECIPSNQASRAYPRSPVKRSCTRAFESARAATFPELRHGINAERRGLDRASVQMRASLCITREIATKLPTNGKHPSRPSVVTEQGHRDPVLELGFLDEEGLLGTSRWA